MASFSSILEALTAPASDAGGDRPVTVRLLGRETNVRPLPGPAELALRRALPKPGVPLVHRGGSLSERVPVERDTPEHEKYRGELDAWYLDFRATVLVAAAACAQGTLPAPFADADAAAAVAAGKALAGRTSLAEIDAAFSELDRAGADLSASSLAMAQRGMIAPIDPAAAKADPTSDMIVAQEKGGDGVTLPYALPPHYSWTAEYFAHLACTLYGCTPDVFFGIDAATRVGMVAFARLRHAELRRETDRLAVAALRP